MKTPVRPLKTLVTLAVATVLLSACSTKMVSPQAAAPARAKLTQLQNDPQLATRAPVAIKAAETAVIAAEKPRPDHALTSHLVFMAEHKVDIASAQANTRLLEDQRKDLTEQRDRARLDSRTREADSARIEAEVARNQASSARNDADVARNQASSARDEADIAHQQADELQRQIAELNAKPSERGLVVTLGDVLFATGRSDLKGGSVSNLSKLAAFLNKHPDCTVTIEGHTDSVGSDDSNMGLSQRRADAVKSYLVREGVGMTRLAAAGMGEGSPVADNESSTGRQQNRRVEVIIANMTTVTSR